MKIASLFLILGLFMPFEERISREKGQFVLLIKNIQEDTGLLQVALFSDEKSFLKDGEACYATTFPVKKPGEARHTLPDLPIGPYSIAVFHDLNQDGKLNTNLWGIPTEPYAFSRTPENKWKKPTFQSTHIQLQLTLQEVRLELKRWKHL